MEIKYSEKSVKQLTKIIKGDRKGAETIIKIIETYALNPDGNYNLKILKGKFVNFKRLRVGNYRIIFEEDTINMNIYEIKHRKEAYR